MDHSCWCKISCILLAILSGSSSTINPIPAFERISRLSRQGNKYDEEHVQDVPARVFEHQNEFDFIIVGGGSAGSVLANRLSEIPDWNVLLLESGPNENAITEVPLIVAYLQSTSLNWGYRLESNSDSCLAMLNNSCQWPRGRILGGTSAINYMIYTRGNSLDYDLWEQLGNPGWNFKDVLPYFLKSEMCLIDEYRYSSFHSRNGYLNVERIPYKTPLVEAFMEAAKDLGYPAGIDYNTGEQLGFSRLQVNQRSGWRCGSAKAFLRPVRNRKNLKVSVKSHVTRILIDEGNGRAKGVEFVKKGRIYRAFARKEVILSAGTINSPQILMLSGIGPREHLQKLEIPVFRDLPVGNNLQEHVGFLGPTFLVNQSVSVVEDRIISRPQKIVDFLLNGTGIVTLPGGCEGIAYVRTTALKGANALSDPRPDVELLFIAGSISSDNKGVSMGLGIRDDFYDQVFAPYKNRDTWSLWPLVMHPYSRGTLRLRNKNPFSAPILNHKFFSDPRDLEILVEGIKIALRVGQSLAFARYGTTLYPLTIPGCRHLPSASDAYWACAARYLTGTLHHQVGTCKMGPYDDVGAVVDAQLRVYGVRGLRVVDASIMPTVPTAHINAPVYMIAEKAADIIKATWRRL